MQANDNIRTARTRSDHGFSLIEALIVMALIAIVAAMAVPVSRRAIDTGRADSAVIAAINAVDTAHDRAVAERRNFVLTFVLPDKLRLGRQEVDSNGAVTGTTTVNEFTLENGHQLLLFPSIPTDTPDQFGNSAYKHFTGPEPVMFTSDGSLVDANGDVTNGSIFLGIPGQPESARAVTIFGVTGLTRTWKWRGSKWME
jgi:prepilin-type N-terminal cleavage/methylation domain-containing protein